MLVYFRPECSKRIIFLLKGVQGSQLLPRVFLHEVRNSPTEFSFVTFSTNPMMRLKKMQSGSSRRWRSRSSRAQLTQHDELLLYASPGSQPPNRLPNSSPEKALADYACNDEVLTSSKRLSHTLRPQDTYECLAYSRRELKCICLILRMSGHIE